MIYWHNLYVELLIRILQDILLERIFFFLWSISEFLIMILQKDVFLILRDLIISPEDLTTTTVPRMTLNNDFPFDVNFMRDEYENMLRTIRQSYVREQHENSDIRRSQFFEILRSIEKYNIIDFLTRMNHWR